MLTYKYSRTNHERAVREVFPETICPESGDTLPCLLLAFVNRSGSNYLGELLQSTGKFAGFEESLNEHSIRYLAPRYNATSLAEYLRSLHRAQVGQSSRRWGMKVGCTQLAMLLETDAIPNVLTPSIVLIRRRDIIAQAISYYIASHTAQWSSNEPAKKDRAEIVYDGKAILGCLRSIMNSYAIFEQIRVLANLPYEEMFYEDLLDSPFSTVGGLVQRLTGHSHSPRISSIKSAIQRDDKDHELKVQFIADLEKMQWEGG